MLSETKKNRPTKDRKAGVIMKVTKKGAMEYAKENWIDTDRVRIVDTYWSKEDKILRVITITKETHRVYKLVIAYDDIREEYYKLKGCDMFAL